MLAFPLTSLPAGFQSTPFSTGFQPSALRLATPRVCALYAPLSNPSEPNHIHKRLNALHEQDGNKYKPNLSRLLASGASDIIPGLDLKRNLDSALTPDVTTKILSPTIPTRLSQQFFNGDEVTRNNILGQVHAITDATPISLKLMLPKIPMTGMVIIVPGFAEKSDLSPFKAMVEALLAKGHGVAITRLRDQGPWGQRGHLRNALQLMIDLKILVDKVQSLFPEISPCIVGHSTGGLGLTASKVFGIIDTSIPSICINPWLGLRKRAAPNPELVKLGRTLYDAGIRRFPFRWGDKAITCASFLQMEDLIKQLKPEIAQKTDIEKNALNENMVFFQSRLDPLVDPKSVEAIAQSLGSPVRKTPGAHSPHHVIERKGKRQKDAIVFIEQLVKAIQETGEN